MKLILATVFLLLLSTPASAQFSGLSVFVSIPPQKQFIEKIGGNHVNVNVMLPPGESPETYSPSPKMLVSLSSASLYFQIGVPFEKKWLNAIRSINNDIQIISCCEHLIAAPDHPVDDDHHDLHIWSSPAFVMVLAREIKDTLVLADPVHADDYIANYHNYIAELNLLDAEIRLKLAARRIDQFIVSHASWGYFADQYGLEQVALEKNNKEIGPRSLLNIIRLAEQQQIRTLFLQEQYKTPAIISLARELKASVVDLDPLAEDYLVNMRVVTDHIAAALK